MKEKFKKVKDRPTFYRLLSNKTGCDIQNVSTNWFARSYLAVPKDKIEITETFLDKYLQFEQEKTQIINQLHEKYFGKNQRIIGENEVINEYKRLCNIDNLSIYEDSKFYEYQGKVIEILKNKGISPPEFPCKTNILMILRTLS